MCVCEAVVGRHAEQPAIRWKLEWSNRLVPFVFRDPVECTVILVR